MSFDFLGFKLCWTIGAVATNADFAKTMQKMQGHQSVC